MVRSQPIVFIILRAHCLDFGSGAGHKGLRRILTLIGFIVRGNSLRRWLGRLAFYPGWPSAVFLTLILSAILQQVCGCWLSLSSAQVSLFEKYLTYCLTILAGLIFPKVAGLEGGGTRLSASNRYLFVVGICLMVMVSSLLFANIICRTSQYSTILSRFLPAFFLRTH